MSNNSVVKVEATITFKRNLRNLSKKYRHIFNDIKPIIKQLETGNLPGVQKTPPFQRGDGGDCPLSGIDDQVFKLRVKNSDIQKGKSGGYRLIYYVKTEQGIILLTIYPKSEPTNITNKEIINIIQNYQK